VKPCVHGFPKPANCWDCMYDGNIEPRQPQQRQVAQYDISARYTGRCVGCSKPIHVGQTIALMDDGTYRHEWCTEDE
jgi:hypothetical protein